ncbi:hypothetical protein EDB83DRAFT_2450818 [Lactarius deliciosus]|nr:hypothetical protein EDB83DRAFT_2450818 [Lactarius deliciosus]
MIIVVADAVVIVISWWSLSHIISSLSCCRRSLVVADCSHLVAVVAQSPWLPRGIVTVVVVVIVVIARQFPVKGRGDKRMEQEVYDSEVYLPVSRTMAFMTVAKEHLPSSCAMS